MNLLKQETGRSTTVPEIFFSLWWEKWANCRKYFNGKGRLRKGFPIGKRKRKLTSEKNFQTFCFTLYACRICVGLILGKLRSASWSSTPSNIHSAAAAAAPVAVIIPPLMEERTEQFIWKFVRVFCLGVVGRGWSFDISLCGPLRCLSLCLREICDLFAILILRIIINFLGFENCCLWTLVFNLFFNPDCLY